MNVVVLTIVAVLSMLAVDICLGQNNSNLTCDKMPKVDLPSNEVLAANSPFDYEFCINSFYECTRDVYTKKEQETSFHEGRVFTVKGSDVVIYDYIVESDNKTVVATSVKTGKTRLIFKGLDGFLMNLECPRNGEKSIWYASAAQFDKEERFICAYSCNGTQLEEFVCYSNNNGTTHKELEAVNLARQMPNGHRIHNAQQNCSARNG